MANNDTIIFNQVNKTGKFGNVIDLINANFNLARLAILNMKGKSAYEMWREEEGNENKTESEFWAFLTADKGWTKEVKTYAEFQQLNATTAPTNVIYVYPNSNNTEYYAKVSNGTTWVTLLVNNGDITALSNDVNTIKDSVSEIDAILNGEQSSYIPDVLSKNQRYGDYTELNNPISNGESVKITVLTNDVGSIVNVYGKTNSDDSSYQALTSNLQTEGSSITVVANRDINYVRVVSSEGDGVDYTQLVSIEIELNRDEDLDKGLVERVSSLEGNFEDFEGLPNEVSDLQEQITALDTAINGEPSSYVPEVLTKNTRYGTYASNELTYPIALGEKITITLLSNEVGTDVSVYGRETTEKGQTLASKLLNIGDEASVIADRNINYVQFISAALEEGDDYTGNVSIRITIDKGESETYQGLIARVEELENKQGGDRFIASKIYNPPINFQKSPLRILDIGNSFSQNAMAMQGFINMAGLSGSLSDFCLYSAVRSGGSFKNWYDIYHGNGSNSYSISLMIGGYSQDGIATSGTVSDNTYFVKALTECQWDIIIIHQKSDFSADTLGTWEGNTDKGYLKEYMRLIRTLQPSASIGFLFTHVSNKQSPEQDDVTLTKHLTTIRWSQMVDVNKRFSETYNVDFIIPVGTAIENLRASSLNTTKYNFSVSSDNHHLANGLAKYVAGATYFMSIFGLRFGKTVYGSSYNSTSIEIPKGERDIINVTPQNATIAQMCAILALNDMWNINTPNGIEL